MESQLIPIAAIALSSIALLVAVLNYRRKSGSRVRGYITIASSIECEDRYVSTLFIENLKDRAITIFAIYLRVGHNYYIRLEDLESRPLILRGYESFAKEYGPIEYYGINLKRINLNKLLADSKLKKRLVLSTADGKLVVPPRIKSWNPIGDYFRNHFTAVIYPIETLHKGRYVGGNIRYVVDVVSEDGHEESVLLRNDSFGAFRNFRLTAEALKSAEQLRAHLTERKEEGSLRCRSFNVLDLAVHRANRDPPNETFEATYISWFLYHGIGRLMTRHADWKLARENSARQRQSAANEKLDASTITTTDEKP